MLNTDNLNIEELNMEDLELADMELEEIQRLAEHLLSKRKYSLIRQIFNHLNAADIALLFDEIDKKDIPLLYRLLPKEEAAECFSYMSRDMQKTLINTLTDRELRAVMDDIFLDDTVDMIEEMPANVVARILRNTDEETRKIINQLLNYPKDSAGSLMTVEYVNIKKEMTVGAAISRIRRTAVDKETIYTCYVTENRKLIGMVSVKDLLMAEDSMQIEDIMETNVIHVDTHEDREEVAKVFNKYDFLAIPVVDREERLVGIVTFDDAMDVMQEEHTEDMAKMAAIMPTDDSYFNTSAFSHADPETPVLNSETAILENANTITFTISGILGEGMEDVMERIEQDFAASDGDGMEVINPYETNPIYNVNLFVSQYCAAKEKEFADISIADMAAVMRRGKSHLYSSRRTEEIREKTVEDPETREETTVSEKWMIYTVLYNGEDYFADQVFALTEDQKELAADYAQNLSLFLGDGLVQNLENWEGNSIPSLGDVRFTDGGTEVVYFNQLDERRLRLRAYFHGDCGVLSGR